MLNRSLAAITLSAVFALASGCANSGNSNILPMQREAREGQGLTSLAGRGRVRIREFSDLPEYSDYYSPAAIAAGPDGRLWVTDTVDQDYGENAVVGIATSGKRRNTFYYPGVSSEGSSFDDITAGPDGALWITDEYNEQIVRMATGGKFSSFPLKNFTAPFSIVVGPDGALWFTATARHTTGAIGRITTTGSIKVYPAPAWTWDIAAGADGALWFTEPYVDRVGRISTQGIIKEYSTGITPGSQPYSIAAGPDGALWFTERAGRIGRITTSGKVTEYSSGITPSEEPTDIAAGPDGNMWFTEAENGSSSYYSRNAKIGSITVSGGIKEYSRGLNSLSHPTGIVAGADGRMWFVESAADKTGRITI
ncbi:MAG TPA: Virginiamycin B lyase [Candidatus Dormibacteraeota bacterium]|nr:Virginiamycin B lyase [Candidatus Dormibacteraeota bacterium]